MSWSLRLLAVLGLLGGEVPALAAVTIDAVLDPDAGTITGTVEMRVENRARVPLDGLVLLLYPNRFRIEGPGVNDLTRPFVQPREEHEPGGIAVEGVRVALPGRGFAAAVARTAALGPWPDGLLRVPLPAGLAPGAVARVRLRFSTRLPRRYGPFGVTENAVTALDGWFPMLAALRPDGTFAEDVPPVRMPVRGTLRAPGDVTVVIADRVWPAGHAGRITFAVPAISRPALLASRDYRLHERDVAGIPVRYLELPHRRAHRLPRPAPRAERIFATVAATLARRPAAASTGPLLVVEAPLRLELTAPGAADLAVISDRTLRVHRLLRSFHERELARAIEAARLQASVAAREPPEDAGWVLEAVTSARADDTIAALRPDARTVDDWIHLFGTFAIVDRFESAPKVPFRHAFFPEAREADETRDTLEGMLRERPPGRTILTKLRNTVGDEAAVEIVEEYGETAEPFRALAARIHGEPVDALLDQWLAPYPEIDYALDDVTLNRAAPGGWRHELVVRRRASRLVREAVEIEVQGPDDEVHRLVWDDATSQATFILETPWRAKRAVIDPERRLLETTRANDASPAPIQVVLDSADVTVTSSEFGLAGLFVARRRYDYTKDVGMIGFFNNRSIGFHLGPRLHFGSQNDATSYRHNLHGFYTLESLRSDFRDDSRPAFRTDGTLSGLGLRYDYGDEFAFDNPTGATKFRLFGDWFTEGLGSSFDFLRGGARLSIVRPLLSRRTLLALQLLNGFSTPVDGSVVPNQGRFSLGGDLAIRGIAVEEELGEHIALIRVELRQTIYPQLDLNLADLAVLRHGQVRLFVDSGRVSDRVGTLYEVGDFAVGVGVALAVVYDFLGFHPSTAYVAVAQRVDRFSGVDNDVQFLFGTRQAF